MTDNNNKSDADSQRLPANEVSEIGSAAIPIIDEPTIGERATRILLGGPRDLRDKSLFHSLTLVSILAWIGLGADALSSSSYGPQESFRVIHDHPHIAVALAVLTVATVFLISQCYSRMIEIFPNGGGYGVASRMLGKRVGVVSGCALLIDYVLTITVSIAAVGDALFSFIPQTYSGWKLPLEFVLIIALMALNLRGVKESIVYLTPIFLAFILIHIVLIGGGFVLHVNEIETVSQQVVSGFHSDYSTIGLVGMLMLLLKAYSLGGGTYTGIEAVSNALPLLREPRVATAQRTMMYLAISLSIAAAGLLLCYLLWDVREVPGKTANAVLAENVAAHLPFGSGFVIAVLVSEAALLIVAAQAGFIAGPRVLANMAVDSWMPHRFSALSERLNNENGIFIMSAAALGALWITDGNITMLVVMYATNVFMSFSLTMLGMMIWWWREKAAHRTRRIVLYSCGFFVCSIIFCVTVYQEFDNGGRLALITTGLLTAVCLIIHSHYALVANRLMKLYSGLGDQPRSTKPPAKPFSRKERTAVILVGRYGGVGIHTVLNIFRIFPGVYHNLVFLSVGVVDSGAFKGQDTVDTLRDETRAQLQRYIEMANALGIPSTAHMGIGTDAIDEAEQLCLYASQNYQKVTFFSGKIIFQREHWYHWLLHNNTANALQKRLHWAGHTMVIVPARVR
jgi:amino acid transporter